MRPLRPGWMTAPEGAHAAARAERRRRERRADWLALLGLAAVVLLVLGWVPA